VSVPAPEDFGSGVGSVAGAGCSMENCPEKNIAKPRETLVISLRCTGIPLWVGLIIVARKSRYQFGVLGFIA
jgi:hypothetical protein